MAASTHAIAVTTEPPTPTTHPLTQYHLTEKANGYKVPWGAIHSQGWLVTSAIRSKSLS
jgi:hypothetical protein